MPNLTVPMSSPIPDPSSNIPATRPSSAFPSEKGADLLDHQLPPSYAPFVQQPYPGQPIPILPHFYVCPAQHHEQPNRRRRLLRRFFVTFAFGVTIWILVSALIRSVMLVTHFNATSEDWPTEEDFPIPPELKRVRCVWGDETPDRMPLKASYKQILKAPLTFPFKKEEKFELPIDSETLFFLSRGVYSGGHVKIVTTDKESDVAQVKVRFEYLRPGGPKIAKVCQFTRADGENGIGIFTPDKAHFPRHHGLRFYVTIKLPKSKFKSPELLHIKKFETDLPNFTQTFCKVGKHVVFDDISITGANGGILGPLVAGKGSIETSNGPVAVELTSYGPFYITSHNGAITGTLVVTGSLALKTDNERIKGVVALIPDAKGSAKLDLITKNTIVNVDIVLNPFEKEAKGGIFDISAISSNSPVSLKIREAPIDSKLLVNVSTSHAPAEVLLPPTYEGDFDVNTVRFWPTVLANPLVHDPSGEGRKRDVSIEKDGDHVKGNVSWSEEGKDRGHVELGTSYSPAVLRL